MFGLYSLNDAFFYKQMIVLKLCTIDRVRIDYKNIKTNKKLNEQSQRN